MFDDPSLPTHLRVGGIVRRLNSDGQPAYILAKGDPDRGTLLIKLIGRDRSCRLELEQRDIEGVLRWMPALPDASPDEAKADAYIERTRARDPDVWVIEIEVADATTPNPFAD
ncbi:MAG: DUF1491 family protein [Alphaproteobacteria bacterium]|nr:DUF1491 family protein [Alphaproteobacteria bacterium SS10]